MTSRPLPERPNLEQLKKQAKTLLHTALAGDPVALQRFTALPGLVKKSVAELRAVSLALHDAQSVIAREHGFPSWNALREHVEERMLSFAAAVDEFVRCATGGAPDRARRLLALHPGIAGACLQTALVLGDAAAVETRLRDHPELATKPGGPQNWEPLLYVCHSFLHREEPVRVDGLVAIARRLLAWGADPNGEYHWNWHPELPRTVLWGALIAMQLPALAEVLLASGANPTDGVSTHIAAGGGNLDALELLHRHGMNVNGIPGGVPPLRYLLGWANTPDGARWLLDHGADPNLAWGELNDAPLHVAAQRWDVAMVEMLVRHGADVNRRRADGKTAHTLAELHGNHAVAAWLRAHGAVDELTALERFIAACARGDRTGADAMLATQPGLREELQPEHHRMLQVPAERGDVAVLSAMLACGFDPNVGDPDRVTALHRAAMAGHPEAVRVLLAAGAKADALDGMFAATPLVWAVEGWTNDHHPGGDHVAVARVLLAAGSPAIWQPPEAAPGPERTLAALAELCRAAAGPAGG